MSLSKPTLIIASPDIPFQEVNKNESGYEEGMSLPNLIKEKIVRKKMKALMV